MAKLREEMDRLGIKERLFKDEIARNHDEWWKKQMEIADQLGFLIYDSTEEFKTGAILGSAMGSITGKILTL